MLTLWNQRWRDRRGSYRPAGETIDTRRYEVASIEADSGPKAFVVAHHYSGSYPAARFRFGLYRSGALVGIAVFSHPTRDSVLTSVFPCEVLEAVELGRFVLLDDVPGNGETWFLGRCFEQLRSESLMGVLAMSDPAKRTRSDGSVCFAGHIGNIYQAHNARYIGQAPPRTIRILPNGSVFSARAAQKIRSLDRGCEYAAAQLERAGAPRFDDSDPRRWLRTALAATTRTMRHPGNHKYAWALNRRIRRQLPDGMPYPKFDVHVPGATEEA
jgi:hypothetical protein